MALVRATTLVRDAMSHSVDIDGTEDGCQSIMPAVAVTDTPCLVPTTAIAPGKAESRTPARRMAVRLSPRLEAASRWGFFHLSHFAADYQALFGELPSSTLRACGHVRARPAEAAAA